LKKKSLSLTKEELRVKKVVILLVIELHLYF